MLVARNLSLINIRAISTPARNALDDALVTQVVANLFQFVICASPLQVTELSFFQFQISDPYSPFDGFCKDLVGSY